ncbi:MAG: FAD-dependent thymidylate synthase [Ruminococcaceae bacterium]|nr:FAD-dependent thymidylate synthase [Oscillospiraceae bacterium]
MATVTLISHTPDPERAVAAAARLCYSPSTIGELFDGMTDEKVASFVEMLASMGHESPIEHVTFTFGIEGVSRALLAQITRHRIASFSVQSQRYVKEAAFEYVTPPEIASIPEAAEAYQQGMADAQALYSRLSDILFQKHFARFMEEGKPEKAARSAAEKAAIEDARFVLPNACDTKMIVTMNARSLLNFFRHRCCTRAQWEIRDVACQMLELVKEVAPHIFAKAGPSCVAGPCPEGKMSCGRVAEMRERFLPKNENE